MLKFIICCIPLLLMQCKSKDNMHGQKDNLQQGHAETIVDRSVDIKKDEVELKLQAKMKPQRIITSFNKYNLELKCVKDKVNNVVVLGFDPSIIELDEIVGFLDKEVGVVHCKKTEGCEQK